MTDRILILDFGSQVTQLIARRVRESGVYCEILPFNTEPQRIADFAPKGVILSGGPASVTGSDTPRAPAVVFELGVPVLGGQFFRWRFLTRGCWWQSHPFSLSAAGNGRWLRITVKIVGQHTADLRDLEPGTRVWAEGPCGRFTAAEMADIVAKLPRLLLGVRWSGIHRQTIGGPIVSKS